MSQAGVLDRSASSASTFTTDSGVATVSGGNINVLGGPGTTTSGSGDTVTITLDGTGSVSSISGTAPIQANGVSGVGQVGVVTVSATNATASSIGVASFNATHFTVSSGAVSANNFTVSAGTGLTGGGALTLGGTISLALSSPVSLANGGTNASLTASNGGIFYSTASAGAILAGTASANQILMSGASTAPTWSVPTYPNASVTAGKVIISDGTNYIASTPTFPNTASGTGTILRADGTNWVATTATYPSTTTINQILYSSSANTVAGLATGNNGVLITSATGVPSLLAAGTTGQVLTATTGSPPSWSALSGMGVTSITGTANQIIASASTGAITLSAPQNLDTAASFRVGTLGINAAAFGSTSLSISQASTYAIQTQGTITSGGTVGIQTGLVYSHASTTTSVYSFNAADSLRISGTAATTNFVGYLASLSINSTRTISNYVGFWGQALSVASGPTITAAYTAYFANPGSGTAATALYADDASIGYTGVSAPTNGLIVSGRAAFGTSTIPGGSTTSQVNLSASSRPEILFAATAAGTNMKYWAFGSNSTTTNNTFFGFSWDDALTGTSNWIQVQRTVNTSTIQYVRFPVGSTIFGSTSNPVSKVDINGNVSIGSYAATSAAPSNGLIVSGSTSIGSSSAAALFNVGSSNQFQIDSSGNTTISVSSNAQAPTLAMRNSNAGSSAFALFEIGNDLNADEFIILTNSSGNSANFGAGNTGIRTKSGQLVLGGGNNSIMFINNASIGILTSTPDASAALQITSVTQGLRFPNMSTSQMNAVSSPGEGLVVFNNSLEKLYVKNNSGWLGIQSGLGGSLELNYKATATSYTALNTDTLIGVTSTASARTITLPATVPIAGWYIVVKDESGAASVNNITISGNGHNIDGSASILLSSNYGVFTIYSNGTQFYLA